MVNGKTGENGLAFFQVVAIITNLSTVFRGAKIYFFMKNNNKTSYFFYPSAANLIFSC